MRSIPLAMREKLKGRIRAVSEDSEPGVRIVATQASRNTLLTEPIHEDIPAALGDVALKQTEGKTAIELAYAICLDNGKAHIYQRRFPATMDYEWEFVWEYGTAEDVAIEFDGDWTMDGSKDWYYLVTEEYPYIFTVEGGNLYCQRWRDESTRLLLARGVSSISACKGWHDYTNLDNDQGLIIGYIRDGEVYYRSLSFSSLAGGRVWENEHKVESLGTGNISLSVIRTNDFRIGFMTEKSGQIRMALTGRTYPGASVRPEYLSVGILESSFKYLPMREQGSFNAESVGLGIEKTFFLFDSLNDNRLKVTGAERIFTEDGEGKLFLSGVIIFLDRPLIMHDTSRFMTRCTVSSGRISVTSASYDEGRQALVFGINWNSGYPPNTHPVAFTLSWPFCTEMTYKTPDGQIWYLDGGSIELPQITNYKNGFAGEAARFTTQGSMIFEDVRYHSTFEKESVSVTTSSAELRFVPVGDIPV